MYLDKTNNKLKIILLIIIFIFIVIILRVGYIELIDYKRLSKLSSNLWTRSLPITGDRGKIYDRNGIILADNITTTSLILIPNQIKNKEKTSIQLANILGITKKEMDKHVYKNVSIERVHPEGRKLEYNIANKIDELKLDGVYLIRESKRYYPYGKTLSHVLGHVGIDNQGLSGIELIYDKYLTGSSGEIKYLSDAKGNKLKAAEQFINSTSGMNIYLTIDINIQLSLERELDNADTRLNPDNSLGIVMDPNTGEILAMASRPTYDNNNYQKALATTINRNLPIWMSYEPGSTFKIITMASSIEEKIIDIEKDTFYDTGKVKVNSTTINCWKHSGHGYQTFLQVLENSCNPGFVKLGLTLGKEKLFNYFKLFGFGEKTGINLNGESTGIMFDTNKIGDLELATSAFGQGISVTPIQQVTAVSSVVNGGILYKPNIIKYITEPISNNIIIAYKKEKIRNTISKETSDTMKYALESVVARGGGHYAYIEDYRIGGKTGTAQKVENGRYLENNYIMSFMSVVPANDPKAVFYIAIDNPKKTALLSSHTTAPIARTVLLDIIENLKIPKQPNQIEKVKYWDDPVYEIIPNIIGMDITKAKSLLKNFNIITTGSGTKIIDTTPRIGSKVEIGSNIKILLSN